MRYIYRNIGRVLEDVANAPMVAYDLGVPGTDERRVHPDQSDAAPRRSRRPRHSSARRSTIRSTRTTPWNSRSTAGSRTTGRRSASYRWSRLRGNFEGFYRDDNGQSDPGITSLYDFPTNDPSYTAIGVPQFGIAATSGISDQNGILPLDRPHQVKVFGNYELPSGLNLGVGST